MQVAEGSEFLELCWSCNCPCNMLSSLGMNHVPFWLSTPQSESKLTAFAAICWAIAACHWRVNNADWKRRGQICLTKGPLVPTIIHGKKSVKFEGREGGCPWTNAPGEAMRDSPQYQWQRQMSQQCFVMILFQGVLCLFHPTTLVSLNSYSACLHFSSPTDSFTLHHTSSSPFVVSSANLSVSTSFRNHLPSNNGHSQRRSISWLNVEWWDSYGIHGEVNKSGGQTLEVDMHLTKSAWVCPQVGKRVETVCR